MGLSKSIYQPASMNKSTSGNGPRYVDTERESSRTVKQGLPLFRGDKYNVIELDKRHYRARVLVTAFKWTKLGLRLS